MTQEQFQSSFRKAGSRMNSCLNFEGRRADVVGQFPEACRATEARSQPDPGVQEERSRELREAMKDLGLG